MPTTPAIVLVTSDHRDEVVDEFTSRYARDYGIVVTGSGLECVHRVKSLLGAGSEVAMVAAEHHLPDVDGVDLLRKIHDKVPTSRRVCLLAFGDFRRSLGEMRAALAARAFDTFLLIPRGPRDEEFHTAIIELLSDWTWSVATPVVASVDIVCDEETSSVVAIRDLLDRMGMPSLTHRPDSELGAEILDEARDAVGPGEQVELPVVRSFGRAILVNPTAGEVAEAIYGSPAEIPEGTVADVVVVGAGPAGLATAVYAASEGLSTIVLEADAIGGQAGTSSMIRNYLGFPRGVSGMRLAQRARVQAGRFGARFYTGRGVVGLDRAGDHQHVVLDGVHVCARTVVVSTGVAYRRLGVQPVEDLVGVGVHYGAATSVAREMAGRDVFVVGGGNSAGQAAVHLARFARSVTIVVRRPDLRETMSEYLVREIESDRRVSVRGSTRVVDGGGEGHLEWLLLRSPDSEERVPAGGLFLMLGAEPHCDWLPDEVARDDRGYVLTGRDVPKGLWLDGRPPASLETSAPGVFAAGDVRAGSMKRVASASGEGASVIPLVHAHLQWMREQEFTPAH